MNTICKNLALILIFFIVSCNKEKEILTIPPTSDIQIKTNKDSYTSSEYVVIRIMNNTKKEYSVLCIGWPAFKIDPIERKEILENDIWTQCPVPPDGGVFYSFKLLADSNQTINDTLENLTNFINGTYRLKYRFRLENTDTIFYSNDFEINEN
jgi:hypothetical protein